jgi:flagellar biosynthesis/type III secretory pathway M-ring protein FliF/YscJ
VRDNYDFSDAIKNPFAGKINGKYTVTVHYDFSEKEKREDEIIHEKKANNDVSHKQQA